MAKRIEISTTASIVGSGYPAPFAAACAGRVRRRLGDAAQLTDFGVNLLRLAPGAWSSQRHWHTREDEFAFVLEGEVVLVSNAGEEALLAGASVGFKAGLADGHQLQNRSQRDAVILEIGSRRSDDEVEYPDIDMRFVKARGGFVHRDGTPYPKR